MGYSSIKRKTCKCGCGGIPAIGCEGYKWKCLPEELKETNNTYEYPDTLYPKPEKPKETPSKALTTLQMVGNNPHAIPQSLIEEWISIRKKKRAPITPTVWKKLNEQISHCHCSPIAAFEEMISRGWLTVKPEWVNKNTSKNGFYDEHSNWVKDEGVL